jgi:hypothetical protein
MDLDGAHQEDSQAAKPVISGRQIMCVNTAILVFFLLVLFSCGALLKYFVYLVLIVIFF